MVCLIDTSVWIALHRRRASALGQLVLQMAAQNEAAVCGQVWVEFIGGFRNAERRQRNAAKLADYIWLGTSRQVYELAAEWLAQYRMLGAGDAIVAATAKIHGASLLTLDDGFQQLARAGLRLISVQ